MKFLSLKKLFSSTKQTLLLLLCIHLTVLLWKVFFVIFGFTDLHFEEAQYWMWSKKLDWSYYSKPPMIAYVNYLSTSILGDTEIGIRVNAILLGLLTSLLIFFFSRELWGCNRKAFIASVLTYAMPFYQGAFFFFSTDSLVTFFWLLFVYFLWKAFTYDKLHFWILAGVAFGLGNLSKYTMLLAIPFVLIYLLIYHRNYLKNYRFYFLIFIPAIFAIPLIIWSIKYDFINLSHVHATAGINAEPKDWLRQQNKLVEYVGSQLIIISPFFLVMYFKIFKKFSIKNKIRVYLLLAPGLIFLVFIIVSLVRSSGANINWPMFAYITLPMVLADFIVEKRRFISYYISFSLTVVLLLFFLHTPMLDKIGLGRLLPPKADPAKRIVGWSELGKKLSAIKATLGEKSFVFSNKYYTASELSFYVDTQPFVYYFNDGDRLTQFELWKGLEEVENQGFNAIYVEGVDLGKKKIPSLKKPGEIHPEIVNAFDKLLDYQTHTIRFRGRDVYFFHIYVLKNFKSLRSTPEGY